MEEGEPWKPDEPDERGKAAGVRRVESCILEDCVAVLRATLYLYVSRATYVEIESAESAGTYRLRTRFSGVPIEDSLWLATVRARVRVRVRQQFRPGIFASG